MQFAPDSAALLMIDMQNGFLDPRGSIARIGFPVPMLAPAVEPCRRLLLAARASGIPVAHTRYVYAEGLADGGVMVDSLIPELRRENALVRGTWDAETIAELAPAPGEPVFDKNRPSALLGTGCEAWLRHAEARQVIVAGITTTCCVETTVRDLAQRDWEVFIPEEAVAEFDEERHRVGLRTMGLLFARVLPLGELLAAMGKEWADAAA